MDRRRSKGKGGRACSMAMRGRSTNKGVNEEGVNGWVAWQGGWGGRAAEQSTVGKSEVSGGQHGKEGFE